MYSDDRPLLRCFVAGNRHAPFVTMLTHASSKFEYYDLEVVDVNEYPELAEQHKIVCTPMLQVVQGRAVVSSFVGDDAKTLSQFLANHIGSFCEDALLDASQKAREEQLAS
jgi:thioredoxin-like negative regulator of GroEL